ncbi:(d)CMP kinase [Candidatus Pantoea edessiphila]|uniref:Cytidylate kinase n=1 Tax=Candidatus Pantoea edessiphila TaxID=2044610 RepID=A0A2P5SX27_9GAMM|nr:(d)CMP kinase [Candidatus Pantoea edessiphila]PPI86862.1 cytidylate kinase [Candidatus Pantoea edessiphila]
MMAVVPVITIDGPSGVGKSTICKEMGKLLKWNILDSGAIYRSLAFVAINNHINLTNSKDLFLHLYSNFDIKFFNIDNEFRVILNKEDVTDKIREEKISKLSSILATLPVIRKLLLIKQRNFVKQPGLIADGRDMGTVVFPYAKLKIFLYASLEERANRRNLQLKKNGFNVKFERLLKEIKNRDDRDYNRKIAPLLPASDALIINSENISVEEVIEKIKQYAQKKLLFHNL